MEDNFSIITLGYIFDEHIHYADGTIAGPFLGGTVSYSSVCLGRLGVKSGIVSNIGVDTPDVLINPFRDAHIDLSGLNARNGISITKNILKYDSLGNKEIVYLTRAPTIQYTDIPKNYFRTRVFYFCPVDFEIEFNVIQKFNERGYILAADLGGFGGAHSSLESRRRMKSENDSYIEKYLRHFHIVKASLEDAGLLFGTTDNYPEEIIRKILDFGVKIALITLGESGAVIGTDKGIMRIPAFETRAVDCTGAGDTYMAAFLAEYLETEDIRRAGYFASAASSILIEKSGGVSIERMPDRKQVISRLNSWQNFLNK